MNNIIQIVNLAGTLGLLGFVWTIANGNKKKVSYDSFDRYKKDVDSEVRTKEVCDIIHSEVNEKLNNIPEIKQTVNDIKSKIVAIETKVDILINGK